MQAAKKPGAKAPDRLACGCAGTQVRTLAQEEAGQDAPAQPGRLQNWPVQLQLVPVRAPYFDGCDLLIAADCTAYACGSFHADFIRGHVTLIGCPKLDRADYEEKLTAILMETMCAVSHLRAWRCRAAAGWNMLRDRLSRQAGSPFPCAS